MLGPYHQLYHGSTRLFKKTFLPYLIVVTILFVVGQIGTFMALSSFSIGSMMLTLISSVLLVAASVWALVLLIFNGRTYNRKLYEQVQGRAEDIPTRLKPALILLVGYAAAMILVSALISVIGGKMVSNAWMENLPSDYDAAQADSSRFTESSDDRTGDSNGNEAGSGSPWLLAEDENFWDGAWENTTTGDVTTFAGFAIGTFYFEDGHIDENGNYVVYLMAPGGNGDEMQAQLLVSSDGTSLIYYIASNAGGLIASDEFKRPTAARNDSLPSELWGNYIYDSGPERNGTLTVDAFRIDDNTYFNARQENGVWVVETGNGIEGWNERLSLLPDGRLSIQDDYSTEPTYYVRVSASGQSAEKEPVPDNPSLDLSRLPQIPSEDTDLFSVCFWTDAYSEKGFGGVSLMGDNSVTVDTLFAAIFDSYSWDDSYMIQQGTEATVYDAVCELDGSQVRLRFSQLYSADIHISEGTIYKADGTIQSLSQYDIACLMSAVDSEYHSRNGSQPYSLARSLRGTWVSDDGQTELTIDGKTYGGDSYTISAVDENLGELLVMITRGDGTVDERWIDIAGDSITVYNLVQGYCKLGVDVLGYAEDLGMQTGPMISPRQFQKYILPSYKRLIAPARQAGAVIHMHSDGMLHQLADDLLGVGVDVLNLQDLVNGIDWIKKNIAGRCCIELDIDRQSITTYGTPAEIDRLIRHEVETLGSRQGGLCMIYGLYPGTPIENAAAVMDAMEKYAFLYT